MPLIYFAEPDKPKTIGLLVKNQQTQGPNAIETLGKKYLLPIAKLSGKKLASECVALGVYTPDKGKLKSADCKMFSQEYLEQLDTLGVTTLIVTEPTYFEYLSGAKGLEKSVGQMFSCAIPEFEHIKILPCLNYQAILMYPAKQEAQTAAQKVIADVLLGVYVKPEKFEFHTYKEGRSSDTVKQLLNELLTKPELSCDIETTGLYLGRAEILTIAFAWDKYSAYTMAVHPRYGSDNRALLKQFFKEYKGRLLFHNGLFDTKHLIYNLFMKDFSDLDGMFEGLACFAETPSNGGRTYDDTMIYAYLARNSTERPTLGLKDLAHTFLGDYAEDVKETLSIPLDDLLRYNAKDVCGTWYVYETVYPEYLENQQERVYNEIMKPSVRPLLQMMINGLPLDMKQVAKARKELEEKLDAAYAEVKASQYVKDAVRIMTQQAVEKYNSTHVKQKSFEDFDIEFNPGSSNQLRILLFDVLGYEPIEFTDSGQPSTNRASIKEFHDNEAGAARKALLSALIDVSQIQIILNTFITAFEELSVTQNGLTALHGNLKLAGTQSGRLSSSEPNLQNIPSNSAHSKTIKQCFVPPPGFLFCGADFNSLEDRIGAILSGDPNKTAEFTKGIDGHALRAAIFYPDELAERGIVILDHSDPKQVNKIKELAPDIRQNAKPISFLKQYGGGISRIQHTLKCSYERAKQINDAYDKLYEVQIQFTQLNTDFAKRYGYVEGAFGLRLKTPKINRKERSPRTGELQQTAEAAAEARSSSNMVTQSFGVLMNRAFIEFSDRIYKDGLTKSILLINTIHDAIYLLVKDDPDVISWVNKNLTECMAWQDDPALHSEIKLSANLDIGFSWRDQYELPHDAPSDRIAEYVELIKQGDKDAIKAYWKS